MFVAAIVMSVLLALVMVSSFARKLRGAAQSEELRRRLCLGRILWLMVGGLELCAAAGLLAGLIAAPLGAAAAIGIALLMAGAVIAHLRVGMAGAALLPPLAVLAVAGTAAALQLGTT